MGRRARQCRGRHELWRCRCGGSGIRQGRPCGFARSRQPAADSFRDGAAQHHCRDRQEIRTADPAHAVADPGLDPRPARRSGAEAAEGKRPGAGRRYRRRLRPEDQPLSGRRHRGLCRGQARAQGALARRSHRRVRRRHPWPRPDLDRRIRARRQGPRAGLPGALGRRHRRLYHRHRRHHSAGARPLRAVRRLRPAAGALRDQGCDDQHRAGRRLSRRGPARRRVYRRAADGRGGAPDRDGPARHPQGELHQARAIALHQRGRPGLR